MDIESEAEALSDGAYERALKEIGESSLLVAVDELEGVEQLLALASPESQGVDYQVGLHYLQGLGQQTRHRPGHSPSYHFH